MRLLLQLLLRHEQRLVLELAFEQEIACERRRALPCHGKYNVTLFTREFVRQNPLQMLDATFGDRFGAQRLVWP